MFSKGLEVPPNWVVVPYGPTASESKFAPAFHTVCAWLVTVKPLNTAIKDIVLNDCFIFFVRFNLASDTHCMFLIGQSSVTWLKEFVLPRTLAAPGKLVYKHQYSSGITDWLICHTARQVAGLSVAQQIRFLSGQHSRHIAHFSQGAVAQIADGKKFRPGLRRSRVAHAQLLAPRNGSSLTGAGRLKFLRAGLDPDKAGILKRGKFSNASTLLTTLWPPSRVPQRGDLLPHLIRTVVFCDA